ncbi:MAG: PKD domain-containing protein, partial [Bacteroidia bacterium]
MKKRLLISILFVVAQAFSLNATHIIGGEIYYDCLGNNQFRVVLKLYRDCLLGQAPYDNPANVAVYNSQGVLIRNIEMNFPGSSFVPQGSINPCYQDEANLCVEEAVYEEVVTLTPISGGYTLVYQRCCRNESILNIYDPGDTGATYMIKIPESAFTDCNSSPRFNIFPPIVLCINDPLQFDHSAVDPDGDSLVYFLCDPFEGASPDEPMPIPPGPPPYNFVNFIPPYSANNPLPSSPGAAVDPSTGQLTGFPTQTGQFVVAVCVNEYRDGTLLSTNKRDFQFNVVNCSGESTALFDAPTATIELDGAVFCNGLIVNFIDQSDNALFYLWDFGVPGIDSDVSTAQNPVYIYPDTGRYVATLIVNPGYSCADTA